MLDVMHPLVDTNLERTTTEIEVLPPTEKKMHNHPAPGVSADPLCAFHGHRYTRWTPTAVYAEGYPLLFSVTEFHLFLCSATGSIHSFNGKIGCLPRVWILDIDSQLRKHINLGDVIEYILSRTFTGVCGAKASFSESYCPVGLWTAGATHTVWKWLPQPALSLYHPL